MIVLAMCPGPKWKYGKYLSPLFKGEVAVLTYISLIRGVIQGC
jgi:hypothetical protein